MSKTLGQLLPFRTSQRGLCNLQSTRDDVGRNEGYCVSHCCFSLFRGKYKGLSDILFCLFPSRFHIHDVDSWHHYVALAFIFFSTFPFWRQRSFFEPKGLHFTETHTHILGEAFMTFSSKVAVSALKFNDWHKSICVHLIGLLAMDLLIKVTLFNNTE